MDVLDILDNLVCRNHLLSFLKVNDLLRLRRVCKSVKNHAQDFIRTQKIKTETHIYINFRETNPFKEFNEFKNVLSDLPKRTRADVEFFLNREKSRNLRAPLQNFMDNCGVNIVHLTLRDLTVPLCSKRTRDFFESFVHLTQLEIENIEIDMDNKKQAPCIQIPSNFKNLKILKIYKSSFYGERSVLQRNAFTFLVKLVDACISNLERLVLPFKSLLWKVEKVKVMRLACTVLKTPNLKIENVHGTFIEELLKTENRIPEMGSLANLIEQINDKVISIRAPQESSFLQELPHLEKIDFKYMNEWKMPGEFLKRDWPKLKEINAGIIDYEDDEDDHKALQQRNLLFGNGIRRESVTRLDIGLGDYNYAENEPIFQRTMDFTTTYPNLKILHIVTYDRLFISLQELWSGLPILEELKLDDCVDMDFIGNDPESPVFWNLKRLKILEMGLTSEEGMTDVFLSKVLCHMPLKELYLSSCAFNEKITLDGIKSLLNGKFASTIEILSFRNLHLKSVSETQLKDVQKLFRSSQMI